MSITDRKGINVTSGFKLISPQPIDARMVVEDENELVSIVDSAAAYEGQLVYVKSLDKYVSFDGTQFNELETGGGGAYVEGETLYLNAAESGSSSGSTGGGGGGVTVNQIASLTTYSVDEDGLTSYYSGFNYDINELLNKPILISAEFGFWRFSFIGMFGEGKALGTSEYQFDILFSVFAGTPLFGSIMITTLPSDMKESYGNYDIYVGLIIQDIEGTDVTSSFINSVYSLTLYTLE